MNSGNKKIKYSSTKYAFLLFFIPGILNGSQLNSSITTDTATAKAIQINQTNNNQSVINNHLTVVVNGQTTTVTSSPSGLSQIEISTKTKIVKPTLTQITPTKSIVKPLKKIKKPIIKKDSIGSFLEWLTKFLQ